jgi:HEAT repeat protein
MVELRNKGRWRKKLWILLGCGIAAILLLTLLREREPQYQGRPLSQWLAFLAGGHANDPDISLHDAEEAIDHIGTNALPFLIKWVQYEDKPWRTRLGALCEKLPDPYGSDLRNFVLGHGYECQQGAFFALYRLGTNARPAIPVLAAQLKSQPLWIGQSMPILAHFGGDALAPVHGALTNPSPACRIFAIDAVAGAYWAKAIDPSLIPTIIHCLGDTNRDVAFCAAQILCTHDLQKKLAMRTFIDALESADKNLRGRPIHRLKISLKRGYSVPELLQFLQDTNSPLSPYAAGALEDLADDGVKLPETVLPALTNSLHDPRPSVRAYAADAIGHFKSAAEPAAPALLDLWTDPDNTVRQAATNAFYELPSCSFLRNLGPWPIGMSQDQADMYARRYGITPYTPALTRLLEHPDIRIRQMATNAFRTLRGSNVVNQSSENENASR